MNKLIINSDDFGYSKGINYAIVDTYKEGILSSTTLMTNTPGFEHAVQLAQENKGLGVGVHLVLTFLKPLRKDVSSLINTDGNFYSPKEHTTGNIQINPEELYKEWDTQINKVFKSGISPTHLDSHHHIHSINQVYLEVFLKLAKKYKLPIRGIHDQTKKNDSIVTTSYFERNFDQVTSLSHNEAENYLSNLYNKIKEKKSIEVMCHVGYIDEFLLKSSSFTLPRAQQTNILLESNFAQKIINDKNIKLSTFADL